MQPDIQFTIKVIYMKSKDRRNYSVQLKVRIGGKPYGVLLEVWGVVNKVGADSVGMFGV